MTSGKQSASDERDFVLLGPPTIAEVAAELRQLAELYSEPAFDRAADALQRTPGGRPAMNDRLLIEEALWLRDNGKVRNLNQALRQVAGTVTSSAGMRSIVERLRRKIVANSKKSSTKRF